MYKQTKLRGYQEGLSNLILAAGFYIQRPQNGTSTQNNNNKKIDWNMIHIRVCGCTVFE